MKMLNKLIRFLFRVRYNTKTFQRFKTTISYFYDGYDESIHYNSYKITKCRLYSFPSKVVVEIHSISPGMIIGKRGECIDRLKALLQKQFTKPVEIKLEETNPFK